VTTVKLSENKYSAYHEQNGACVHTVRMHKILKHKYIHFSCTYQAKAEFDQNTLLGCRH